MASDSAPIKPPHMPMQCPPPSRPRTKADSSSGSRSIIILAVAGWLFCCLLFLLMLLFLQLLCFFLLDLFYVTEGVVKQDAVCRAIQIVILAAVNRPEKETYCQCYQYQGYWNHYIQGSHQLFSCVWLIGLILVRRRALSTTSSELTDMPMAAQPGVTQ